MATKALLISCTEHGVCVFKESSDIKSLLEERKELQQLLDSSPVPDTKDNYTKLFFVDEARLGLRGSENLEQAFSRQEMTFAKLAALEKKSLRAMKSS